jgi:hypothetical protein
MIVTSARDDKIEKKPHADDEDKQPHVEICNLLLEQFLMELDSKESKLNYE